VTTDLKTINEEDKNRLSRILDEIRNEQKKDFETEIEVNFDDEPSLAPIGGGGGGKLDVKTGQKEAGANANIVVNEGDKAGEQEPQEPHKEVGSDTEQQFGITELQPRRKRFVFSTILITILRTAGWMQL
jgi:hypothetical protein